MLLKKIKKNKKRVRLERSGKEGTVSAAAMLASGDFLFPFSSAQFITYATDYFPLSPCQSQALRSPLFAGGPAVVSLLSHFFQLT